MEFPPEPYLEFRQNILGYAVSASGDTVPALQVEFYFQDGDGDIGRESEEEIPPYTGDSLHNLHFHLYEILPDSQLQKVYLPDSTGELHPIEYHYHLHYIEPVNANNALRGTIRWEVDDFPSTAFFMQGKTICYGVYLYDRALHKSNTIYTHPIRL